MTIDETNRSETKYLLLRRAINLRDAINHNKADEKILLITDSIQSLAASLASAGSSLQRDI
jgi:hypothetical protein